MSIEIDPEILSLDFFEPGLESQIRQALNTALGACLVRNMPCPEDNNTLETLALALGTPLLEKRNIEGGMTCRVEPEPNNPVPVYANTPYQFLGHTDCSDFANPPDTVFLLCESPAESGGESVLSPLSKILPLLSLEVILGLQQARFLFGNGYCSVLSQKQGKNAIRYNRVLMDVYRQAHELPREAELERWLDDLDQAIYSTQYCFKLQKSDCLIMNNQTTVHGRLAFDGEKRLLKRVRLTLK